MKHEDFNCDISNEEFMFNTKYTESTEALKDIVKKVAKKAADKAGIIPAGNININKNNIKGFHQAARVLLNYGQSRELINRSFKGIDIKKFGSKANLDTFMNSIKPVGKFHVAQGWLIFDLMETDTYKLKNDLNKEDWDNVYDAAEMVTKKANYTTIRIIKELFGSRGIELHPNSIGHLLSKNGAKSRLMFKLGKVKIEDGTFENSNDLVDRIRFTIGAESADPELTYEDDYALEDAVESANSDYEFFEAIGIESEMIAIAETFGEIEDLNEMIAIESAEHNYLNSLEGLEAEIDTIINAIDNLEISLESFEEGTEGFKEVANEIVKQGRKLIKAILRYFNIGLSLHEQGLKTAEIIRKVSKKTISELKTLPKPAQEKFEFRTSFISMTQYYMNRVYSNNNKSFPLVSLAENINRVYNAQGRKFNEDNIVDFSKRFEELSQISIPQVLADIAIVNTRMNYDQTLMSFGELLGIRGEHAARKCTGDVETVVEILKSEINNVEYSPKLIEALKGWLKGIQSIIKPYKTMLINLGRATKGLTKDIASAIRKSKAAVGIESVGFESSIKDTDTTQVIVNEILSRMEQDPILKLAKDKDLIEIKANPKAKRKISINFKEIKEIEKILTPEDIQKYGGSTYQFLLKLSDTFNKNIMWNMKEIEETAKSVGNNLDTEAVESLKGRGYYIYKGIESLDDLIEEMIMMENGLEDFDELKDSAKAWIKKAIAVIMDFLSKDKVVYFFQVRNFQDIQKKVRALNEYNMDDYDLYVLGKISGLFSDLNKSKSYFYRKLKAMNFNDGSSIKTDLKGLKGVSNKVKTLTESIDNIYDLWKDKYKRNPNRESKKGAVGTVKSTILKMKFEYIDVRQNFLELEKKIEEGVLSKANEEALRAFLNLSKSMQSAYLKGATKAMKMIRKMLYNPEKKPSNESFEGIIEYEINWDWVDIETKGVIGLESKYDPHPLYKGIMDKAEADITKIAKKVTDDILKTPEYKEFKEEVERKAEKDDFLRKHIDEVLKINGNYVESTYTSIELISYDEEVYYMDSWNKLESAIVRELNKYADKVFCRPGYKWVFDKPADDQPQFTAYIKKVSDGNESINDIYTEYIDNIIALESSENSSIINALNVIKNGIISFIKPLTPSGRREALKKKEEEQAELAKAREKEAEKLRKREESIKYYKEYAQKALPIAKKEAEKILKTLPKTPEYKTLLKEAKEYGEKEGYDALDSVYFFVDGNEYDSICLIGYDQDMFSFDALYKVEDVLIKMLRKIANKIPHPDGFHWDFCGPYDDEACIWMDLYSEGEYAGDESIESGLEYSQDEFRSINSTFKSLKTSVLPIIDKISNEVLKDVTKSKEYKKLIEMNKDFKFEIGDIYDKGDIGSSDRFEVFEMTDTISGVEMSSDVDAFVKLVKSKFRDKISSIPIEDGFKWDIVIHYDKVSSFYCQLYPSYFEGTEDGHIRVLENTGAESEVVQAIYDEFWTEGITSIIKRITSYK